MQETGQNIKIRSEREKRGEEGAEAPQESRNHKPCVDVHPKVPRIKRKKKEKTMLEQQWLNQHREPVGHMKHACVWSPAVSHILVFFRVVMYNTYNSCSPHKA